MEGQEYKFTFFAYPLNPQQAEALRERLEQLIIKEVEKINCYTGPLEAVVNPQGGDHGEGTGTV